jgi:hypothetical protein
VGRKAGLEQARENHRLASLRYEVGVGTSLEVLQASEQLLRIESRYVEALFNYHLAVLTFETAKVAPVSGLSAGASTTTGSSTSTRQGHGRPRPAAKVRARRPGLRPR